MSEKILGILMKLFVWTDDDEKMLEAWHAQHKEDCNCWSFDEKGFGVYLGFENEKIGVDIDFTPEQQVLMKPVIKKLNQWAEKYGE